MEPQEIDIGEVASAMEEAGLEVNDDERESDVAEELAGKPAKAEADDEENLDDDAGDNDDDAGDDVEAKKDKDEKEPEEPKKGTSGSAKAKRKLEKLTQRLEAEQRKIEEFAPRVFALEKAAQTAATQVEYYKSQFETAQRKLDSLGQALDPRDLQLAQYGQLEQHRKQELELQQAQTQWLQDQRAAREVNDLADQYFDQAQSLGQQYGVPHQDILDLFAGQASVAAGGNGPMPDMSRIARILHMERQQSGLQAQAAQAQRQRAVSATAPRDVPGGRPIPTKLQGTVEEAEAMMRAMALVS